MHKQIVICDRCENEECCIIEPVPTSLVEEKHVPPEGWSKVSAEGREWDLCSDCFDEFRGFLWKEW